MRRAPGDPRDLAAAWFAYLSSGEATDEGRQAFERWRRADPEHDRQFRSVQQIWDATLQIPAHELRGILARRAPRPGGFQPARRRFALGLAGACCLAAAGTIGMPRAWLESPDYAAGIESRRGERRQMTLPDGSVLDVNTGSLAQVRLYERERIVDMRGGEIFFDVQSDAQRPFIVNAGDSRIVARGTRFNVRHEAEHVQVSVESGAVDLLRGPWWRRESRSLARGQAVDVRAAAPLGDVRDVDLGKQLAWQRGKIVFENTPLAQAVAEINRYLEQPARLDAPSLRDFRIAGIFSVDDPLALIDSLPEFAPVKVLRLQDGRLRIMAA